MARRFLLGVCGGIAAYKAATLVRIWKTRGDDVVVIPTPTSLHFVGATTWEALSGHPAHTSVLDGATHVEHVDYAREADALVIAPATANTIARLAAGISNDLLTTTVLSASCPVIIAPAMHTQMWENPATQRNIATLQSYGYHIINPTSGALTSGDHGIGRLAETEDIAAFVDALLHQGVLAGRKVVVSGGGTREPIDPVRFIGNASSGKQAAAIAQAAQQRGADVTFVAAHIDSDVRASLTGMTVVDAPTAASMKKAMLDASRDADITVMAAAVADFRPRTVADNKIKKASDTDVPHLEFEQTDDVLRALVDSKPQGITVGFAAETGSWDDVMDYGRRKVARKGCDYLVVNNVSHGDVFGKDTNRIAIINRDGQVVDQCEGTKKHVADVILSVIVSNMPQ